MKYSADITAGSLKIAESRIIAGLILENPNDEKWKKEIIENNILKARSKATAIRLGRLIRKRLELMKPELWKLIRDGVGSVAVHATLAAAVKHSPLLGDFLDQVVREQYRIFNTVLSYRLWEEYLEDCHRRESEMPVWEETTVRRLRSSIFHIIAQAGYIEDMKTKKLQKIHIASQVISYLEKENEQYVLRCIQVEP
ncbi:MAG: DUF1819 family protein [Deltaproteobacteria bacterium]|nr:DUF1819 family protein [Deltaproteobacteria bacterium]